MLPFLDKIASLKGMRPLAMRNELDDLLLSVFNAKERYNEKNGPRNSKPLYKITHPSKINTKDKGALLSAMVLQSTNKTSRF